MPFYQVVEIGKSYQENGFTVRDAVSLKLIKLSKMKVAVYSHNKYLGEVYKSSHGVWVAQPDNTIFSKSFLKFKDAVKGLTEYHYE